MTKSCILLGGGASISEGIALGLWDKIKESDVWSLNFAFLTTPFLPKREIWVDVAFFRNNMDKLQSLYVKGVKCYAKKHPKYADIPEITTFETTRDPNESDKKMFISRMGLSGFFALSLAVKEKYEVIYLLGFDWGQIEGEKNTHYYQGKINVQSTGMGHPELYRCPNGAIKDEIKDFEIFLKEPSKIYNVSPKSHIPYFERIDYPTFFKLLENDRQEVL